MIVYNVTVQVDAAIADPWLAWMEQEHLPDMLGTGCFTRAVIHRMLEVDETDGPTYAVQYHADSKADYNRYIRDFSTEMRRKGIEKWGERFIAFRSVMQVVH